LKNLNLKPFLLILLAFSGLVWFAIAAATGLDMRSFVQFMRPIPQVVTADLLLVAVFTRWLWRWRVLQGWLVPFPDLNGTWQGYIETDWQDPNGSTNALVPAILTIKQNFGRISCVMRTSEMESHSYVEGYCIDKDAQVRRLCYAYRSTPRTALRSRSTPHDGAVLLDIIGDPVHGLRGEYWTQRKTTGSVTLAFRTRELLDELPADLPQHPPLHTEGPRKAANGDE